MNYNYFEGKNISVKSVIDIGETLPFFSERRLILVENSGFFTSTQEELCSYLQTLPESTCVVFVEKDVDKRNKLYKTISKIGYAAEMKAPDERTLTAWILKLLKGENRQFQKGVLPYFLERVDTDMENISCEIEKLVLYTEGRYEITREDVDTICTVHTETKVFDMIQAIAEKKQTKAFELYYDLVGQKEPSMKILYWITRQFNQLYQIKDLEEKGYPDHVIAERMGVRDFVVRKNKVLCQRFTLAELRHALNDCVCRDEDIKTGKLNDQIAVELLITRYSV